MSSEEPVSEVQRQQIIAENKEASKPILSDLLMAGFKVEYISDLYNKRLNYRQVIPILLNWLPKVKNLAVKEEIVRALSVPWARGTEAPRLLVNEFSSQMPNSGLQWAVGNALSVVADDEILDEIIDLIGENQHGKAREMLVVALGNMKTSSVDTFLIELLDDEKLAGYAIMALGKLKSSTAAPIIESFLNHPIHWIRTEAIKALKQINK